MRISNPRCYLIAETAIRQFTIQEALGNLGVTGWSTDAQNDAAYLTEFAGKTCYMSFDTSLNKNLTKTGGRNNAQYIQDGLVKTGHGSVLEHASVTFFIVDVSRVVTHELIRHRAGTAFSQTSGRYVRTEELSFYVPQDIRDNEEALAVFKEHVEKTETRIKRLSTILGIDKAVFAVKKRLTSAIRRLIGNGQSNNIVVTANHRAWRHMIEMRTDPSAEEEIRVVFADISKQLRTEYPEIYADAVVELDEATGIEVTKFRHSKI